MEECLIVTAVGGGGGMFDTYCYWWWRRNLWYLLLLVAVEDNQVQYCSECWHLFHLYRSHMSHHILIYIYWNSISGQRCSSLFRQQLGRFVEVFLLHKHSFSQSHPSSCWKDRQFLVTNKHAEPVLEKAGVKHKVCMSAFGIHLLKWLICTRRGGGMVPFLHPWIF